MKPNPILEELWRIKDDLAREAGYDPDLFFENLRQWAAHHPHTGPVLHNTEELRQFMAEAERKRAEPASLVLNVQPPRPKT